MDDLPAAFLARMRKFLGNEFPSFEESLHQPAVIGLRVNTLKLSKQEFQHISPFKLSPIPWSDSGFKVIKTPSAHQKPGRHPYHPAGLYYLQEPSAMLATEVLEPQPGERILDLAAAPGGKATHIAALMQNKGLLVANDIHSKRIWDLAENLERCGVRNAVVTNESPKRLAEHLGPFFDKILIDAPCSGEGLFRKNHSARKEWSFKLVKRCSDRQTRILDSAADMLRSGGRLVYSTCTFSPEENEGTLARFLDAHSEFTIIASESRFAYSAGQPGWIENCPEQVQNAIRLWPHLAPGEGHFVALLKKRDGEYNRQSKDITQPVNSETTIQCFQEFRQKNLASMPITPRLFLAGSYLYHLPTGIETLSGLRVINHGWWLGRIKKGHFIPAHALVLGLCKKDAKFCLNLDSSDSASLSNYLRGESLNLPENLKRDSDWVMITVDGFPLGWGKRSGNVIKNRYPRGLRWF